MLRRDDCPCSHRQLVHGRRGGRPRRRHRRAQAQHSDAAPAQATCASNPAASRAGLARGGMTWTTHRRAMPRRRPSPPLWAAWDSGMSVPRPWARTKRALPLPFVERRRRRMRSQHQTCLARCAASLGLGWRFLYLGHSRLRLWAAWDSGRSVPRPWARSKRALPLPLVARRRRRMPSQHQTSLARCAASLALGWRFLWLWHSRLRLWAAWDSGMSVPRPWARNTTIKVHD